MLTTMLLEVWKCSDCEWAWFKKDGIEPARCPNVRCRKRFNQVLDLAESVEFRTGLPHTCSGEVTTRCTVQDMPDIDYPGRYLPADTPPTTTLADHKPRQCTISSCPQCRTLGWKDEKRGIV